MTHLLAIMQSISARINTITPESSIIPYHSFSTPVSLCLYLTLVYQILSLHHGLQCCCGANSADMAKMNTWKGSYAYDIALSTSSFATAIWYNTISWIHVCASGRYTAYRDSYISLIENTLSMNPFNSAITHRVLQILNAAWVLCHAVTLNDWAFTHKYYVLRSSSMQGHMFTFQFSVLYWASTKNWLMSQVFFRCVWFWCMLFCSMYIGFSRPPILSFIQNVLDECC